MKQQLSFHQKLGLPYNDVVCDIWPRRKAVIPSVDPFQAQKKKNSFDYKDAVILTTEIYWSHLERKKIRLWEESIHIYLWDPLHSEYK